MEPLLMLSKVSINNVNAGKNRIYFKDNTANSFDVQADGFTVPLKCSRSYTLDNSGPLSINLKLVVADRVDTIYDSWVFIQRGVGLKQSLQLTPPPTFNIGCSDPIPNASVAGTATTNDPASTIFYVDTIDPSCNSVTLRSWTGFKGDCFDSGFQYIYRGITIKYPPPCGCLSEAGAAAMFIDASSICTVQQPSANYTDSVFDPNGSFVRTWKVEQCSNLIGSHTQRFYNCSAPIFPVSVPDSMTFECGVAIDIPYSISPSQAADYPGLNVTTSGTNGTQACGTSQTVSLSATYCGITTAKNILVSIAPSNVSMSISLSCSPFPSNSNPATRRRTQAPRASKNYHPKPSISLARFDRIISWFVFVVVVGIISSLAF